MPVPHVERLGTAAVTAVPRAGRGLEQCGALPQHLVVIGAHTRDPGSPGGGEFVEIAPALARVPAHQRQVLRREHHRPQHAQHFARRPHRRAVQSGLVRPSGHDLQIDGELAAFVHHDRRDDGALGARPEQAERPRPPDETPVSTNTTVLQRDSSCRTRSDRRTRCGRARGPGRPAPMTGSPVSPRWRTYNRYPDSLTRLTAWPPNWLRSAATAFIVGESSWRDRNRANSDAAMPGTGTRSRIASSTVHRPSPESSV